MRIALFGGTGLSGRPLLAEALARGHEVNLLARTPTTVTAHPALTVLGGNARDADAVAATVAGCEAVMSTLGGFGDSDAVLFGTRHMVAAMRAHQVRRLVLLQGFHLDLPGDPGGVGRRLVGVYLRRSDAALPDHTQRMAEELTAVDDLDWTLVRVPRLVDRAATGRARLGLFRLGPWNRATTGDVADTMLDLVVTHDQVRAAPMLRS